MSDLAPFVAAAIRDKVVQELQEENAALREEMEKMAKENNEISARDAVDGYNGVYRIAIASRRSGAAEGERLSSPTVYYAVDTIYPNGLGGHDGTGFQKMRDCTLGDLLQAEIFTNGVSSGSFGEHTINFHMYVDDQVLADLPCLEDALASVPRYGTSHLWGNFMVQGFSDNVGFFTFDLSDVNIARFVEFVSIDPNEWLENPRRIMRERNNVSLETIAAHFGLTAAVRFDSADSVE